jgi:acetyl-CoA carboxylase biotin carboxyl carrier protein
MTDRIVQDIEVLAALFKVGGWDELRVEFDGVRLLLSNDLSTPSIGERVAQQPNLFASLRPAAGNAPAPVTTAAFAPADRSETIDPGWAPVVAPNLGTFYRSPKPGAAPFVEVGQRVEANTEICLLEVMKLFTSVKAGISGTVRQISAADAELVEGGQVLLYIEPA